MKNPESATITTVAKINKTNILLIEDGEKRIAIKPICTALGIDPDWQNSRIKEDEILGELHKISYATGADGKKYEMATIPFIWVYGWLFSINPKKVSDSARESMIKYKKECYIALYQHFAELDDYLKFRTELAEKKWDEVEAARDNFKFAQKKLESLKKEFVEARAMTINDYRKMKAQTEIKFPGEGDDHV